MKKERSIVNQEISLIEAENNTLINNRVHVHKWHNDDLHIINHKKFNKIRKLVNIERHLKEHYGQKRLKQCIKDSLRSDPS